MDLGCKRARAGRSALVLTLLTLLCAGCAGELSEGPQDVALASAALEEGLLRVDFEDGQIPFFVGGTCAVNTAAASEGSFGLRCDDDATLTTFLPTIGYTAITLRYSRRTARYDAGEALYFEVSYDGATFTTVDAVTGTTSHAATTIALGPEADDGTLVIRFRSTATGFYEYFDLDDLTIMGTTESSGDFTCDGVDDDEDGSVDEDFEVQPTACGVGACAREGLLACDDGQAVDTCAPGPTAPSDATCDGIDDDCDGTADEDCASAPAVVFEEGFEDGLGPFEASGACATATAAASSGSRGVRCDDTASLTARFSTVGARDLTLSYDRRVTRYDSGEALFVEVSLDGSDWVTLEQLGGDSSFARASFALDASFDDQDEVQLRLRSNANGFYERFDLDAVRVDGTADAHNEIRMQPSASDFFAMPWPSDHRRRADGTLQLQGFPGLARGQGGLGAMLRAAIEPSVRGFGTNTAVFFTMQGALDPSTLPAPTRYTDPSAPVMLVNLSDPSAQRVPVLLDMKGAPTLARPGRVLTVMPYPGFSLEPDSTYAVILFDGLSGRAAGVSRAPLLDQLASGNASGSGLDAAAFALLQAHKEQVDAYVQNHTEHQPSDVVAFTVYTTQAIGAELAAAATTIAGLTDGEILARVASLEVVRQCPAGCEGPGLDSCPGALLDATIEVPLFQTAASFDVDLACFGADGADCMSTSGGDFVIQPDGSAEVQTWQTDVQMRFIVPCVAAQPASGWPSIVYASGTGGSYRGAAFVESAYNRTPASGTQPRLSIDHVVGSIAPHQTAPRNDPAFVAQIQPFYEALTAGGDVVAGLDGFTYAFEFNPVFARANSIQNAVDSLYVRRVVLLLDRIATELGVTPQAVGLAGTSFATDESRTTLQGQSQGSHSAPMVLSIAPSAGGFHNAYLNATGGDLFFENAVHRPDLRPFMEQLFDLQPGEIDRFHPLSHLLQTAKEPGASLNYAARTAAPGHILMTNGYQDSCSVREATYAVATAMVRSAAIDVADTSAAFLAAGLQVPAALGVQTVLERPLVPFGAGISGNLAGNTRLFLMLEGGHYGSRSDHAVANYLHDLAQGITPTVIPPPYDDGTSSNGSCNAPRIE